VGEGCHTSSPVPPTEVPRRRGGPSASHGDEVRQPSAPCGYGFLGGEREGLQSITW
jgi:hypothetical protein